MWNAYSLFTQSRVVFGSFDARAVSSTLASLRTRAAPLSSQYDPDTYYALVPQLTIITEFATIDEESLLCFEFAHLITFFVAILCTPALFVAPRATLHPQFDVDRGVHAGRGHDIVTRVPAPYRHGRLSTLLRLRRYFERADHVIFHGTDAAQLGSNSGAAGYTPLVPL